MQMCPDCDRFYDESDYCHCPYCNGEIEDETGEKPYKDCPDCGEIMYWDEYWSCTNCACEIYTDEDDNDGIVIIKG